jgi:cytochrome c oxidase accessory protein FixG
MYAAEAKIYPRNVKGYFARWRWVMVWVTQLVFYGLPWLQWNGHQAVLFDLDGGRFYLFGLLLYPQDLIYLAALMVIAALALFFFTALAGRLWCGYACPQTVYTELFMWIEHHCEGDRLARQRLDAAPWGRNKLLRKGAKQLGWTSLALLTGFTFVGYFTPILQLAGEVATFTLSAWEAFWVLFYALATYGNAGFMREQVCKYMCPYARIQSALIDRDSMIISYDAARGDPRGSRARKSSAAAQGLGDCIDCTLCVQVCPTGIDIRNGLQNECIACAACIDVCDGVMDKMGSPRGLIRYATENGIEKRWSRAAMLKRALRPRVLIYATALTVLCGAFAFSLASRSALLVDVIKDRNTLARVIDDGQVENVYRLQIMNRTESTVHLRVSVEGLPGLVVASGAELDLPGAAIGALPLRLRLPAAHAAELGGRTHPIRFELHNAGPQAAGAPALDVHAGSTFYVPR